jgi:hypothetical protein
VAAIQQDDRLHPAAVLFQKQGVQLPVQEDLAWGTCWLVALKKQEVAGGVSRITVARARVASAVPSKVEDERVTRRGTADDLAPARQHGIARDGGISQGRDSGPKALQRLPHDSDVVDAAPQRPYARSSIGIYTYTKRVNSPLRL